MSSDGKRKQLNVAEEVVEITSLFRGALDIEAHSTADGAVLSMAMNRLENLAAYSTAMLTKAAVPVPERQPGKVA